MCLIVYNPGGKLLDKEKMETAHQHNDDGFGIMWPENDVVKTYKDIIGFDDVWNILEGFEGHQYAIHFRLKTHGKTNEEGCHPHEIIKDKLYLMHNGILHSFGSYTSDKSDSQLFAESLREKISAGKLEQQDFFDTDIIKQVSDAVGGNKILFMDNNGKVSIANEQMGTWTDGVWYSNTYSMNGYSSYLSTSGSRFSKWRKVNNTWVITADIEDLDDEDEGQWYGNNQYYASKKEKNDDDPTPDEIDKMINDDINYIISKHETNLVD